MANVNSFINGRSAHQFTYANNNLGVTGGAITIEGWFQLSSLPSTNNIFGLLHQGSTTNLIEYALRYDDSGGTKTLNAYRSKSGVANNVASYGITLSTGVWYHFAIVYDGTNIMLYMATECGSHTLLAQTASSGNGSGFTIPDYFIIGTYLRENDSGDSFATSLAQSATQSSNPFDGLYDDVRVWNTARSSAQLDANMNKELVGTESGLVAYYKFNSALTDATAGAITLTANASASYSSTLPNWSCSVAGAVPKRTLMGVGI